jgi:4-amino-4-deoxy-L-arabinose transferase-like glycosyltransferase
MPRVRDLAWIVGACMLVYFTGLSVRGLADSEGQRVIPGWAMLDSGDWLVTRLFEQVYVRKPPGMPWAVAASAAIFGESEWSARGVSALAITGLALASAFFAARWFGARAALPAGLGVALWPMLVAPGRTAEIEALNTSLAAISTWLVLELARDARSAAWWKLAWALAAALAITLTGLVKGPAGLPPVIAAGVAAIWLARRTGGLGRLLPSLALVAAIPGAIWLVLFRAIRARIEATGQIPVTQDVSEFLWAGPVTLGRVAEVAVMPLAALASALPVSLAVGLVWDRGAGRAERSMTLGVVFAAVGSLVGLAIAGVHNPRYAMPSVAALAVLAGPAWVVITRSWPQRAPRLGVPLAVALLLTCIGLGPVRDALRSPANSGRLPGERLGASLPDGAEVWAHDLVEARAETLMYAQRAAARDGRRVRIVWKPDLDLPPPGGYLIIRTDSASYELQRARDRGWLEKLDEVATGRVHVFDFALYRVR